MKVKKVPTGCNRDLSSQKKNLHGAKLGLLSYIYTVSRDPFVATNEE